MATASPGALNLVWDQARQRQAVGRFGWKAEQPSVRQQIAGAFLGDMGHLRELFAGENHTAGSKRRPKAYPSGGTPEVNPQDARQHHVVRARSGGARAARCADESVLHGERLFAEARCTSCHVPTLKTGERAGVARRSRSRPSIPTPICCCTTWGPSSPTTARAFAATGQRVAHAAAVGHRARAQGQRAHALLCTMAAPAT